MSTPRMGRPPAGPEGTKVGDLPRVTIRLEPEILERAREHARKTGKPLWRLVQESLRAHLEEAPRQGPPRSEPGPPPAELRPPEPPPRPAPAAPPLRQLHLLRPELKLLRAALRWRDDSKPAEKQEDPAVRDLLTRACAFDEQLSRLGLDRARRRPRNPMPDPPWELSLEDCRRLRRAIRQYLAASDERAESDLRSFLYFQRSVPAYEHEKHAKRIRKEVRAANGKLRAVLKKIPWR